MNQKKEHLQRIQASAQTGAAVADVTMVDAGATAQPTTDGSQPQAPATTDVNMAAPPLMNQKYPWDMSDELIALLKTGHPLLALTMEQLAEQIRERLKPHTDEEVYRVTTGLLSDVLQVSRIRTSPRVV
jgi:transformation/transcription domain-associated protein